MPFNRPFLTAEWRYLLMLNYEIDPAVLQPLVPAGLELDLWQGKALLSMVGFLFLNTRVLGAPIPFHTNFEEVNLRFYVRPRGTSPENDSKRGVVFVKEIVPRMWIANIARWLYGENYVALPMRHTIERDKQGNLREEALVEYAWRGGFLRRGKLSRLGGLVVGEAQPWQPGSEEAFITEHYWGYTRRGKKKTGVYQVSHPAWRVWRVEQPYFLCDIKSQYGEQFEPYLHRRPRSAFLAEGSPVKVYPGSPLKIKS